MFKRAAAPVVLDYMKDNLSNLSFELTNVYIPKTDKDRFIFIRSVD